jgi:hypothetical protein
VNSQAKAHLACAHSLRATIISTEVNVSGTLCGQWVLVLQLARITLATVDITVMQIMTVQ